MLDKIEEATESLKILFKVDTYSASHFAKTYHTKSKSDPMLMMKTMEIKTAIENKNMNDGIELLMYCFGMSPPEAIVAFTHLSKSY